MDSMDYRSWEQLVPQSIKNDSLWRMAVYRKSLLLADLVWGDLPKLTNEFHTRPLSDQLYRATGSIGANIAERYLCGTGRDRPRFYEYALGSAREARDWWYKCRGILGQQAADQRFHLLSEIIFLLLKIIPNQRNSEIRETSLQYEADAILVEQADSA